VTGSSERRNLSGRLLQASLVALAVAGVFVLLYLARNIILPFVVALFLTYLLRPVVRAASQENARWRLPRPVAAFLALLALLAILALVVLAIAPILAAETNHLVRTVFSSGGEQSLLARRLTSTLQYWRQVLYGTGVFPPDVEQQLDHDVGGLLSGFGAGVTRAITRSVMLFPRLLVLIAVPLLAFYMLADGERLARDTRRFLPVPYQSGAAELMRRWDHVLTEYVRGQLVTSLFIGCVVAIGLWAMGVRAALVVGIVAFLVETIPFFGPLFWGVLAVLLALAQSPPGSGLPIAVAVFAIVAQQLDSHLIAPLILGRFCKVHPLLLIFATLLGASLFGLIGMFLAAPVTALARQTFLFVVERVQDQETTPSLRTA
jgi:predicted PurR-regulated permease PerM